MDLRDNGPLFRFGLSFQWPATVGGFTNAAQPVFGLYRFDVVCYPNDLVFDGKAREY